MVIYSPYLRWSNLVPASLRVVLAKIVVELHRLCPENRTARAAALL
jgi:hypothetical protein